MPPSNPVTLDVTLTLGEMSQVVEVTATSPLIDDSTASNGLVIDSQKLENLPNAGRNPFFFSKLDNNVTQVGDPRFVRFQDQSGSSTISLAGGPISGNNYEIDNIPVTDFSNRAVIIPSIEAVNEVKVQQNSYDAEMGRTGGGVFNTTLEVRFQHAARRTAGRDPPDQLGSESILQQPQHAADSARRRDLLQLCRSASAVPSGFRTSTTEETRPSSGSPKKATGSARR